MEKKLNLKIPWCKSRGILKALMWMKLTYLFILLGALQTFATVTYSQTASMSVKIENAKVKDVLQRIEEQSDYYFLYSSKLVDVERRVDLNVKNVKVEDILNEIFKGTDISYKIEGRLIMLQDSQTQNQMRLDQPQTVTGQVKGTSGEAIPGVTVVIKGTTTGTITDFDGKFVLKNVSPQDVLVFSFVGMKSQEVAVGSQNNFQIIMEEETIGVGEVVVTALGFKREQKALGYAVQNVKGATLETVKGVDVGTSLTGKVAGLLVKNSTEFAKEPEIEIRGETPLLVIDGVPYENMTLRDISSDDIEDISILKGATASALYGYRGESGAIMITTKKGSAKQGVTVSINSNTMFTAGYLAIPKMQSTYGRTVSTATNVYNDKGQGSWGPPMEGQEVIQWDPISKSYKPMPYLPIGKDNFKNFLEQGYILNNNVNVVQQGKFGSIRSSATWVRNKGTYPNSKFDKISYTLGGDIKLDKFTLSSSISYNKQTSPNIGFSGYTGYDPMYNILIWSSPDYDIRQYKDYWLVPNESQNSSYQSTNNNPYFDRYQRIHNLNRDIFNGSLTASYQLTPWLKATLRSGLDTYSDRQEVKISVGSFQGGGSSTVIKGGKEVWGESKKGSFNYGLGRGYSINNDLVLSWDKKFDDFTVDGLAGGTMFYTQDEGIEARTIGGLSIPGFYSLNASVNQIWVNSRISKRQVNSVYGRLSLSWKSMVYVEGTARNDWSSTLPESTRSYLYPSVSGSFIASELLPQFDWLSLWKIRASWTSSKRPAGIYDINSVYNVTTNAWGDGLTSANLPTTIRGTDLMPESSSTFELGTNINLYKNRASLDVAVYKKRMYDFIDYASVSSASGYNTNLVNTDEEHTRKGLEITAKGTPIKNRDWQWDVAVNWTTYAQYYTKLDSVYSPDQPWVKVGERTDHYIYKDFLKDPNGNIINNAGLPVYSSYYSLAGYRDPDWIWGLSTSLKYKNFTFSMSADGRVGGLAQTYTEMYMWNSGNHPESVTEARYQDATNPGTKNYLSDGVKVVSGTVTYDTYGNITSDTREYAPNDINVTYESYIKRIHKGTAWGGVPSPYDLYSTTFFKIREVSLTYELPKYICEKFSAQRASISAVGQNVFFWAKDFKYSDPDGGTENFADPAQRFLGFNLKVSF